MPVSGLEHHLAQFLFTLSFLHLHLPKGNFSNFFDDTFKSISVLRLEPLTTSMRT